MQEDFADGFALVVGTPFNFETPTNDVQAMVDVLVDDSRCAYPESQVIRILPDAASQKAILDGLDQLAARASETSTVVIFYSGHGVLTDKGAFFLAPEGVTQADLDKTGISGQELARRVAKIRALKVVLILDCCHAGAAELASASLHAATEPLPNLDQSDSLGAGWGRVVLAASLPGQRSESDIPVSVFTNTVIQALGGAGTDPSNRFVRLTDVIRYTCSVVAKETGDEQTPVFISTGATDFPVARYAGTPAPVDADALRERAARPLVEPTGDNKPVPPN
jgi:uncharacterized caspase-like protein